MMDIRIDAKQLERLVEAVGKAKKSMSHEIATAINAAAKKTRLEMGRDIREFVVMTPVMASSPIKVLNPASRDSLSSTVSLKKTNRLPITAFGAKKKKRGGVSYKISKKSGRVTVSHAFEWEAIGHMFVRKGKARLPIFKLHGVSPYGVFTKNNMTHPRRLDTEAELYKQIERRINLNVLRANGLVKT